MKILIVGLGYAGGRFKKAFQNAIEATGNGSEPHFAYVGRKDLDNGLTYYASVAAALTGFTPDIVVVTVPDEAHAEILEQLAGFRGFVIAEKPLATSRNDLAPIEKSLENISGFCMDLVERYSDATAFLRAHVRDQGLELVRAHFTWGKDRINDHRPTSGVPSEVIHPLDLVQWICGADLSLDTVIGTRSDFSVSGPEVLDSVALSGRIGSGVVTGYSSFVNITRKREVDFVFRDAQGELLYASAEYDSPAWDADRLRVWRRHSHGDEEIHRLDTGGVPVPPEQRTVVKLGRLVEDVVRFTESGERPATPFAGLDQALDLQELLNLMEHRARTVGPVAYFPHGRTVLQEADWERLG
ncbi:Gfo/Idh/MocA family oxidoreductase [Streptomyces monticola]|uniref:Gfo/Idh/MocA family oxidoreductase n=1 Tax=Streptomyces monticola TaxID=2666263 RepID=A0ABW2JHL9_9ACTN